MDTESTASGKESVTQDSQPAVAGRINSDEYGILSGFGTGIANKCGTALLKHIPENRQKRVIIVGAGISGIQQATVLLRDGIIKHNEMMIFDAQDGYGGVWNKNKYPGCACDVPAIIYSTSYFMNKKWKNFFATKPQIEEYYTDFATQYQLQNFTKFKTIVRSCVWDNMIFKWCLTVQSKTTGETQQWLADFVCQCVGTLDRPKFGTTAGLDKYRGISWHTAHWRHDYDLTGKKVAIIGCGPSAAQIIPEIVDRVDHLTVYMRNPPICVPRKDFEYSRLFRWACHWVPLFVYFVRQWMVFRMRLNRKVAMNNTRENDAMNKAAQQFLEREVKDPALREMLTPHSKCQYYPHGFRPSTDLLQYYCKRPLRLDNFYSSLTKPNCTVIREHLLRFTENGIISRSRGRREKTERAYDVIIFGTGFNVAQYLEHEKIKGLGGVDLQEQWKLRPEALYGLAVCNFPNMFLCSGPNTASIWSSQQDNWILQARFAGKAIRALDRLARQEPGIKLAMYPTKKAEREYNELLQLEQKKFVWTDIACTSYYKNDEGWVIFTMPWSYTQFWWMLRKIKWNQWEVISNKRKG